MHVRQVKTTEEVRDKILAGLEKLANPVRSTMSPLGSNVLFESREGITSTNDGVTIAKNIHLEDPIENMVVDLVRDASLKTNSKAGDGTSTSILLSYVIIKEAYRLIDEGVHPIRVKQALYDIRDEVLAFLNAERYDVDPDDYETLELIATISANNDSKIAQDIVETVQVTGLDGRVVIDSSGDSETVLEKKEGFIINAGMIRQDFRNQANAFAALHKNVPVLVTDKQLYYEEEVETILSTVRTAGFRSVVIVARDFAGTKFLNRLAKNHLAALGDEKYVQVLAVQMPNATASDNAELVDLATFLGGKIVSEKTGSLVNNLTIEDFCMASEVQASLSNTLISPALDRTQEQLDELQARVEAIKEFVANEGETSSLERRLASLTTGMVTIKVGGSTPIEVRERQFRYEDALNAVFSTMEHGFLPGGGVALARACYKTIMSEELPKEYDNLILELGTANMKQIITNSGEDTQDIMRQLRLHEYMYGFNAATSTVGDMVDFGVIDPYEVTEMALLNSISVAAELIGSAYILPTIKIEEENERPNE